MANFHVVIPAAGSGSRMGAETPKQYLPLLGKPLIEHTLAVFLACPRVGSIAVAIDSADQFWEGRTLAPHLHLYRCGGASRAATVLNTLHAMQNLVDADDWILVHDAARPGLSAALLDQLLSELEHDPVGGLLAMPVSDTLKRADLTQRVTSTQSRDMLWQAQTPQMFRYALLRHALESVAGDNTDEAQAIEALGLQPKVVHGEWRNLKITYPQDLALLEALLVSHMH